MSLAQARQHRAEASALLAQNIDPKAHQLNLEHEARLNLANTFSTFALQYLAIKQKTTKASTFQKREQMLNKYLLPVIGQTPIGAIKPLLMKTVFAPIAQQGKIETVKPSLYYRLKDLTQLLGVSRAIIYSWMNQGKFPPSISLGASSVSWKESDIQNWIDSRSQQTMQ